MNKYILTLIFSLIANITMAAWENFPCPSNETYYTVQSNKYISQLFTGLIERCDALAIAPPAIVDTINVQVGWSNAVEDVGYYTSGWYWACSPPAILPYEEGWEEWMWDCWQYYDNEWIHQKFVTNKVLIYTNLVVTNQFDAFTYNYTSPGTNGSVIVYPPIRSSWFTAFDSKLSSVIAARSGFNWIDTNIVYNGESTYGETFFRAHGEDSNQWKIRSMGKLMYISGCGTWANTNNSTTIESVGLGGYFYHRPKVPLTNNWVLATIIYKKVPIYDGYYNIIGWDTQWVSKAMGPFTLNLIDRSVRPVLEYIPAGTNPFTGNITFTLDGQKLTWPANSGLANGADYTEDVVVNSAADKECVQPAYILGTKVNTTTVSPITAVGTPPNVEDAWRVIYKQDFPVYANNDVYRLYAADINERQRALNYLTHTYQLRSNPSEYYRKGSGSDTVLNTAITKTYNNYAAQTPYWYLFNGIGVYHKKYTPDQGGSYTFTIRGAELHGTNWNIAPYIPAGKSLSLPSNKVVKVTQYIAMIGTIYISGSGQFTYCLTNDVAVLGKTIFYNYGLTCLSGSDFTYNTSLPVAQWTSLGGTVTGQGLPDYSVTDSATILAPYVIDQTKGFSWKPNSLFTIVDNTTWFTKY